MAQVESSQSVLSLEPKGMQRNLGYTLPPPPQTSPLKGSPVGAMTKSRPQLIENSFGHWSIRCGRGLTSPLSSGRRKAKFTREWSAPWNSSAKSASNWHAPFRQGAERFRRRSPQTTAKTKLAQTQKTLTATSTASNHHAPGTHNNTLPALPKKHHTALWAYQKYPDQNPRQHPDCIAKQATACLPNKHTSNTMQSGCC